MRTTKLLSLLLTSAAMLAAPLTLDACGGAATGTAKIATVKPDNMPTGGSWDGVYYNRVWGNLHIQAEGATFKAKWKTADESAWGEMNGTITGNVARFEWTEHKIGLVGPSATRHGKGYFKYTRPEGDNVNDTLTGEWGFDDSEVGGGEWNSVKQRGVKPDLKAIGGDTEAGVGGWN